MQQIRLQWVQEDLARTEGGSDFWPDETALERAARLAEAQEERATFLKNNLPIPPRPYFHKVRLKS